MSIFNHSQKPPKKTKVRAPRQASPSDTIVVYALFRQDTPSTPLTYAPTKDAVLEAMDQFLYIKYFDHFKLWCNLRSLSPYETSSWLSYFPTIDRTDPSNQFNVLEVTYHVSDMCSFMRMLSHCLPLCVSYENPAEIKYFAITDLSRKQTYPSKVDLAPSTNPSPDTQSSPHTSPSPEDTSAQDMTNLFIKSISTYIDAHQSTSTPLDSPTIRASIAPFLDPTFDPLTLTTSTHKTQSDLRNAQLASIAQAAHDFPNDTFSSGIFPTEGDIDDPDSDPTDDLLNDPLNDPEDKDNSQDNNHSSSSSTKHTKGNNKEDTIDKA